jgi:hypothetical protein
MLKRMVIKYYLDEEILYKSSFNRTLIECLNDQEAKKALWEVHEGICFTHVNEHMMAR